MANFNLNKKKRDFPGSPVVKNPPYNAGDAGSIPGWVTKIPHAAGQLSLRATTTELTCLNERAHVLQTTEPKLPGAHAPQLEKRKPARHNSREACGPQQRARAPQLRLNAAKSK